MSDLDPTLLALARRVARRHGDRRVACAESFTAGLVAQSLAAVEGSGDWFLGGVVAYHRDAKHRVLDVREGPVVSEAAALDMASGAARLFGADVAVATTGVAGPDDQDGCPVGTVLIAVVADGRSECERLALTGTPVEILHGGVRAALQRLATAMAGCGTEPRAPDLRRDA